MYYVPRKYYFFFFHLANMKTVGLQMCTTSASVTEVSMGVEVGLLRLQIKSKPCRFLNVPNSDYLQIREPQQTSNDKQQDFKINFVNSF